MDKVLDVRGVDGRAARVREIREMAGRAMLDGPNEYNVYDLEGPLLDLAVANALGVPAVIHRVDNAIAPFFECCVLSERGRLAYQYTPSRNWSQGGNVIEENCISITHRGSNRWVAETPGGWMTVSETPLLAAMRALVLFRLGCTISM